MAEIIVTDTPVNLNVTTTQSNITVTDLETNVTVNVASLSSSIAVTNETVNVVIAPSIGVSNSEIRAALSATSPITYDNTNGVFGFNAATTAMQVSSLNATTTIQSGGNTTVGDGLTVTNNATIGGSLTIGGDITGGNFNGTLKDFNLTYYDAGNVSGNVTLDLTNGNVQKIRLTNNLTGLTITGASAAQPVTLIIQQDNVGFWQLDTTTYAGNWTDWLFTSNFKTLSTAANAYDLLSITYDGTKYYASLVNFIQTLISNAELANSNVIVNGVTISLGGQGNVTTGNIAESGTNLYWTEARSRGALGVVTSNGHLSNLSYSQTTGIFTYDPVTQAEVRAQISANSPILYDNGNGVIRLSTTANITTSGNVSGNYILGNGAFLTGIVPTNVLTNAQVVSYIATQPLTVGGNLTVNGNINATGNINVQNVEDLYVRDQTIVMNANAASAANVQIVANRPSLANTMLKWNEQTDRWTFTNNGTTYYNMPESTTDLAEGANLYYTTDRANTAIGAYQGDINTPGTVTAGAANVTTVNATGNVNATNLYATNNIVASAAYISDGANIQYVRAYSADFVIESTATSLPVLMEAESNNRISKGDAALRYVPATKTLFVSEGTIGTNTNNVAGNNFTISGATTSFGNITTNANVQANFFIGNGSQLTGIPANVAGSENITVTGNVVSLKNALGNVNSITSSSGTNFTINTNDRLVITEQFKGVTTHTGNISGDGYAPFNVTATIFTHSGAGALNSFLITAGNTTSGNATITGVTVAERVGTGTAAATLANISQYYAFGQTFGSAGFLATYPFPPGTYVQSVDSANNTITMNQPASATFNFSTLSGTSRSVLLPAAYDTTTSLLIALKSTRAASGSGSATTILATNIMNTGTYGYPLSGPVASNFVYSVDTSSDYTVASAFTNKMNARTSISAPNTVLQAPRGLIVGNGDLTNRAENDSFPSFGLNILWDGTANVTTEYAGTTPITQLLLKNYSDNSLASANPERGAARIFFTAAQGNKNSAYQTTYLRKNAELGRITWWVPTDTTTNLSTLAAPAYINAVANRDMTGSHNGGIGLYLIASPHTDNGSRGVVLAHELGNTLISSHASTTTGAMQPITFAPMYFDSSTNIAANSSNLYNLTVAATNYQWANINYDNATTYTGSKLSVTNGLSNVAARNGNLVVALDRNDNGAGFGSKEWALKLQPGNTSLVLTEDDVIRTTFAAGGNVDITGNINLTGRLLGYDRVYGEFAYTAGNIVPAAADTIYSFPLDTTLVNSDVIANNTSRINITKPGFYKLFSSIQIKNADNSADHIMRFWLRKNGADVANSATLITPLKLQEQVVSMHWMVESDGDDYWEIVYYVNNVNVTFPYYPTITSPVTAPAAPPIIVNVIPVGA